MPKLDTNCGDSGLFGIHLYDLSKTMLLEIISLDEFLVCEKQRRSTVLIVNATLKFFTEFEISHIVGFPITQEQEQTSLESKDLILN
jgi:hypothetical protein